MSLLTRYAAHHLRRELDSLDYIARYKQLSGSFYGLDPWKAFSQVRLNAERERKHAGSLFELFVLEAAVPEGLLATILGAKTVRDLISTGFFVRTRHGIRSAYCVLSAFDKYLLIDYPVTSYQGVLVSRETYLSGHSYALVRNAVSLLPARTMLDLGCGTGILSIVASGSVQTVLATELDAAALRLAQANIDLNGCNVLALQTNLFSGIIDSVFDLVVFNPPWRLVPPEVAYPNPLARVGQGFDGLNQLRAFLETLPSRLSTSGRAMFVVEFPGNEEGFEFSDHLAAFTAASGCSVILNLEPSFSVEEQARASAQTAWYLNKGMSINDLSNQFLSYYHHHGYRYLHPCCCEVINDGKCRILYVDKFARRSSSSDIEDSRKLLPV